MMKRVMVWMPVLAGCVMMGAGLARDARSQAASSPNTQSMSPARQPQPPVQGAVAAVPQPTGQCRDGSLWTGATKADACKGHKGLKVWFADGQKKATPPPPPQMSQAPPRQQQAPPAAPPASAASTAKRGPAAAAAAKTAAPGGGAGLVWLNTAGNTYHCYGSTYYGKTAHGAYMSEADAKAKGGHPARGQACSK